MRLKTSQRLWLMMTTVWVVLGPGCASPNVNPAAPKPDTGYVDFYCDSDADLCWDIQQFDEASGAFKIVFSELTPPKDRIVRLAFPPGKPRLRVSLLNRVIVQPVVFAPEVANGCVTTVRVTLTEAAEVSVRTKNYTYGGSAKGRYHSRAGIGSYADKAYRMKLNVAEALPYEVKEKMSYAGSGGK